jgi:hypothetical protein
MRTEASHELYAETKTKSTSPKHIKRIAKSPSVALENLRTTSIFSQPLITGLFVMKGRSVVLDLTYRLKHNLFHFSRYIN